MRRSLPAFRLTILAIAAGQLSRPSRSSMPASRTSACRTSFVAPGMRIAGRGPASRSNLLYIMYIIGTSSNVAQGPPAGRVRALAPDGVDVALDVAGSGVLPELIELTGGAWHIVTVADFGGAREHGVRFSSGMLAARSTR